MWVIHHSLERICFLISSERKKKKKISCCCRNIKVVFIFYFWISASFSFLCVKTESNHDTALTLACAGGHEELVSVLIARGANIEHRDKKGKWQAQHNLTINYSLKQFQNVNCILALQVVTLVIQSEFEFLSAPEWDVKQICEIWGTSVLTTHPLQMTSARCMEELLG